MGLSSTFERLNTEGRKAFIPFTMGGYPNIAEFENTLRELLSYGDIVEVGIPFSDPVADGPTIQAAASQALEAGATLERILEVVSKVSTEDSPPIVLMLSFNQVHASGIENFVERCVDSGVRGLIVPDLPAEESDELSKLCQSRNVDLVLLVAPTTSDERRTLIFEKTQGFTYAVALKGVTGARQGYTVETHTYIRALRSQTDKPLCVGFGISKPEQIESLYDCADGFVVGSALINAIKDGHNLTELLSELKEACSARQKIQG